MTLPLLAVAVLFGIVVVGDARDYRAATDITRSAGTLAKVDLLIEQLQQERGLSAALLAGDKGFANPLVPVRQQVDAAAETLGEVTTGSAAAGIRSGLAGFTDLSSIRSRVDGNRITRAAAFTYFTDRISTLLAIDTGVGESADSSLRRTVAAALALREVKEAQAQERAFLYGILTEGGFGRGEYSGLVAMRADRTSAQSRFVDAAGKDLQAQLAGVLESAAGQSIDTLEGRAVDGGDGRVTGSASSWWANSGTVLADLRTLEESLDQSIATEARRLQDVAANRLVALGVSAGVIAIGAVVLLIVAARSITRPLAALATDALTMANFRLPQAVDRLQVADPDHELEPPPKVTVPARSSTEILAVAEALDTAQTTAFELATQQARLRRSTSESLANLGRRNQNLLRRQLGFITQLEREETDPSGLANLFELDHLATRMRRNAESLLVLVGESSPRTWSDSLPVADVLRAAVSEVEDYRRVNLRRVDEAFVGGAFVAGIAHMIAELVENGLNFSPPDVEVEIQGRLLPGRYLIGITDQGLGMDPEDMARANARLRGEESFLSAPTRYLGHYVVGHLARQMGIEVEITPSPVTGVSARVILPGAVLTTPPAVGPYAQPRTNGVRPSPTGDLRAAPEGRSSHPLAIDAVPIDEYVAAGTTRPSPTGRATNGWSETMGATPASPTVRPSTRDEADVPSWASTDTGSIPTTEAEPDQVPRGRDHIEARVLEPTDDTPERTERTRNGLTKRVPRPKRSTIPTQREAPETTHAGPAPTDERSSAEAATDVRSRLTSLRAGFARGEHDHAAGGADRPAGAPGSTSESGSEAERSTHAR